MTRFLIVYGHGAGDPGAVGNGTNERDFNRKTLHPYLAKWASKSKHSFEFYDTSGGKDLYQATAAGGGMYSIDASTYGSITEIHEDAAGASATGGHVIVSNKFRADSSDLALAQVIKKYVGWWGSVAHEKGISYRNDLANMNVAAQRGINYRLMELGFITSTKDMNNIKNNLDGIAKGIIEGITGESLGSGATVAKKIVYQTAPGLYEALRDDTFYLDKTLDKVSSWKIKKGQRFFIGDIVTVGKYTRAKVRLNNDIRYCTMRDDFWKLIYKTKVEKIK